MLYTLRNQAEGKADAAAAAAGAPLCSPVDCLLLLLSRFSRVQPCVMP